MKEFYINSNKLHNSFLSSTKKHVLMITNHGLHEWNINPGLPDTGGQNIYVNQFSEALSSIGFKITIVNRGGFTHPVTGKMRRGINYKNQNQRILFIEDQEKKFIRKEDMGEHIEGLSNFLNEYIKSEKCAIDLIISHYWDAAMIGIFYNKILAKPLKHIWIPHSLGEVKKKNCDKSQWNELKVDERIKYEKEIISQLDKIVSTSNIIKDSLLNDYNYSKDILFLPPCIDSERYFPRQIDKKDSIWKTLSDNCGLSIDEIYKSKIITEISRTDNTKRKDILIKVFSEINKKHPDTLLVITIDKNKFKLSSQLNNLIDELNIRNNVCVFGSIWELLPKLYSISYIYCTPSVVEGFGMSIQEAAATGVPAVSSNLVPFAVEYLMGNKYKKIPVIDDPNKTIIYQGDGAIVVPADSINAFVFGIDILIKNEGLREKMADNAYKITIPQFTWKNMTEKFIKEAGI